MAKSLRSKVKRAARTELRKKYGPVDEARHMYAIQKFDHDVRGVGPGPPVVPKSGFSFADALSSRLSTNPAPANQIKKATSSSSSSAMATERPSVKLVPLVGSGASGLEGAARRKTVSKAAALGLKSGRDFKNGLRK